MLKSNVYYTDSHEWILVNGACGTVGITEYARNELGDIVFVDLPKVGIEVRIGQEVCVLESTKSAADVYAPVSGKIIAINETLMLNLDLINQSPEAAGWLFQVELSNMSEIDRFLSLSEYQAMISSCE